MSVHHQQYGHAGFLSITSNMDMQGVRNKETPSPVPECSAVPNLDVGCLNVDAVGISYDADAELS